MDRNLHGHPDVRDRRLFEFLAPTSRDAGRGSYDQAAPQGSLGGRPLELEEPAGRISVGAGTLENPLRALEE